MGVWSVNPKGEMSTHPVLTKYRKKARKFEGTVLKTYFKQAVARKSRGQESLFLTTKCHQTVRKNEGGAQTKNGGD